MSKTKKPLLIFITGLSGAGLKTAVNFLEDNGIYCIDNLPISLVLQTAKQVLADGADKGLAFRVHLLTQTQVQAFLKLREECEKIFHCETIFLSARNEILELRYSSNRRPHPFYAYESRLKDAIKKERELLEPLGKNAQLHLDTSDFAPRELGQILQQRYNDFLPKRQLFVSLISFGFKNGNYQPLDSLFDARFLKNPFFEPELRDLTGLDADVRDFLWQDDKVRQMLTHLSNWHSWVLPLYHSEGKHYYRIGIACTGGQHRSVAIVELLFNQLKTKNLPNIVFSKIHRDISLSY